MNNGDRPAMPVLDSHLTDGLTKRDAFAMAAMQLVEKEACDLDRISETLGIHPNDYSYEIHWPKFVAKRSVLYANEMLAALEQEQ